MATERNEKGGKVAGERNQTETSIPSVGSEIRRFVKHIDSLADTLPMTMFAIRLAEKRARERLEVFKVDTNDGDSDSRHIRYAVTNDNAARFLHRMKRHEKAMLAYSIVPNSFMVSLVSQYDAYLGSVIKAFFVLKPDMINVSERQLTYAELLLFGSIEAARDHIIEKEVETVLRKSHSEQFDWLEKKFDVKLRVDLACWPAFVEMTERRNLFVHTGGVVSQQYLDVCKLHKVPNEGIIRGHQLVVSGEYFQESYETIFEIGVKLAHVLWRKLFPSDRLAADGQLNQTCYELIVENRIKLACKILDFAVELKKFATEQQRLMFVMNRAQAYKWNGDEAAARQIVESQDWTASSNEFKIAASIIRDDFATSVRLMREIGPNGKPEKSDYRDWPLFRKFRKSQMCLDAFQEVFGEPLKQTVIRNENVLGMQPHTNGLETTTLDDPDLTSSIISTPEID